MTDEPDEGIRLDNISNNVHTECKTLHGLVGFLRSIKKEAESFASRLNKACVAFKSQLDIGEAPRLTTCACGQALTAAEDIVKSMNEYTGALGIDILEPLEMFINQYDMKNKLILKECIGLLGQIDQEKSKVSKIKALCKKEARIAKDSASEEAFNINEKIFINSREEYKRTVISTNQLITTSVAQYNKMSETFTMGEKNRLSYLKELLANYYILGETAISDILDSCRKSKAALSEINGVSEITCFSPNYSQFSILECEDLLIDPYCPRKGSSPKKWIYIIKIIISKNYFYCIFYILLLIIIN